MVDEALGTALLGGRLAWRATGAALAPARALWRSPVGAPGRAFVGRAGVAGAQARGAAVELLQAALEDLAAETASRVPSVVARARASRAAEQALDALFASPLPESLVDRLLAAGVLERVVERVIEVRAAEQIADQLVAEGVADRIVAQVLETGVVERVLREVVESRCSRRWCGPCSRVPPPASWRSRASISWSRPRPIRARPSCSCGCCRAPRSTRSSRPSWSRR